MLILGLNFGFHDPSAALVEDGVILAVTEQERYSRNRHARLEPPVEAVDACLRAAGRGADEVGAIAVGWDLDRFDPPLERGPEHDLAAALPPALRGAGLPVRWVRHHLAHAAGAFWSSGFDRAAVLVVDGQGERESISLGQGGADGVSLSWSAPVTTSLGHFYRAAAQFAGLESARSRGEGKLMGLAAYGVPNVPMPVEAGEGDVFLTKDVLVDHDANTRSRMRTALREWWLANSFPFADDGRAETIFAYSGFAASAQAALEDVELALVRRLKDEVGGANLVLTGGVALNCSANGRIVDSGVFENVHVNPVPHDAGVALGAALLASWEHAQATGGRFTPSRLDHALLADEPTEQDMAGALARAGLDARRVDDAAMHAAVVDALVAGRLVAWFRGRAEVGARALGARSMLADPRRRGTVTHVNRVKGREAWRPLAPSVRAEDFDTYFDSRLASPFMNVRAWVRPEVRHLIPAVTHVDGSARPQAVDRALQPDYWGLISCFAERTGVPVVMNTSLNLAGEPIVSSPDDAVRTFLNSEIDVLAMGPFLVEGRRG